MIFLVEERTQLGVEHPITYVLYFHTFNILTKFYQIILLHNIPNTQMLVTIGMLVFFFM